MAKNDKESLKEKRAREEAEKKARKRERASTRRERSTSFQRKIERDEEKDTRRAYKQERLKEKASSGDPFAQSKIEGQERAAVTAERLGRRSAMSKFRSAAYRKRQGLKDTKEDYDKVLKQEVAKAGFADIDGGQAGGRRAVEALEEKQEQASLARGAGKAKTDARLERVKEQQKRKEAIKAKRFEQEVSSEYQRYKDDPELTERMMTEGTSDLVDSYRELKKQKLNKNQFTKALEQMRNEFNSTGQGKIDALEDRDGNLVIHGKEDIQDEANPLVTTVTPVEHVINKATQDAMQKISGEFRRESVARAKEFEKQQQRVQAQEGVAVAREGRAEERGLAREQRSEARQLAQEGRRTEARQAETTEERAFRGEQAKIAGAQKSQLSTKKARVKKANELTKILGNDKLLTSRLDAYKKVYPDKSEAEIIEAMKRQIKKLRG